MKKRSEILNILTIVSLLFQSRVCFGESMKSISFFFYRPSVTTPYDYKGKDITRKGLNAMLGYGVNDKHLGFGVDFLIGGGTLGSDIGEFIGGIAATNKKRFAKERVAIPVSLGIAYRAQSAYIEDNLIAMFINEPKFLQDTTLSGKQTMARHNFDFMPSIDFQVFTGERFSFYIGYMYRITYSGDWKINYKIPGKSYINSDGSESTKGDDFTVPKELNPFNDSKDHGALRFGVAINF